MPLSPAPGSRPRCLVLAPDQRLRDGSEFRRTVRRGRRSASPLLVAHVLAPAVEDAWSPSRAGLVVSRAVGNAVTRNRVKRRLRHLLRPVLTDVEAGSTVVVRALPAAANATSVELARELGRCVTRAARTGGGTTETTDVGRHVRTGAAS